MNEILSTDKQNEQKIIKVKKSSCKVCKMLKENRKAREHNNAYKQEYQHW